MKNPKRLKQHSRLEIKVNLILNMLEPTVQPVDHKIQNNARKTEHTIRKSIFTKFTANTRLLPRQYNFFLYIISPTIMKSIHKAVALLFLN